MATDKAKVKGNASGTATSRESGGGGRGRGGSSGRGSVKKSGNSGGGNSTSSKKGGGKSIVAKKTVDISRGGAKQGDRFDGLVSSAGGAKRYRDGTSLAGRGEQGSVMGWQQPRPMNNATATGTATAAIGSKHSARGGGAGIEVHPKKRKPGAFFAYFFGSLSAR